jgi:hypothetical protein
MLFVSGKGPVIDLTIINYFINVYSFFNFLNGFANDCPFA